MCRKSWSKSETSIDSILPESPSPNIKIPIFFYQPNLNTEPFTLLYVWSYFNFLLTEFSSSWKFWSSPNQHKTCLENQKSYWNQSRWNQETGLFSRSSFKLASRKCCGTKPSPFKDSWWSTKDGWGCYSYLLILKFSYWRFEEENQDGWTGISNNCFHS